MRPKPVGTIDGDELCGICQRPRREHWGRRSALDAPKLGHQFRPRHQVPCWCSEDHTEKAAEVAS